MLEARKCSNLAERDGLEPSVPLVPRKKGAISMTFTSPPGKPLKVFNATAFVASAVPVCSAHY
jgi:hypothetical protein